MSKINKKINIKNALKLSCPYCGIHPLKKKNAIIEFHSGCPECTYLYEREPGYFTGAMWMFHYGLMAVLSIFVGLLFYLFYSSASTVFITTVLILVNIGAITLYPFSKTAWLYFDHYFHPINQDDFNLYEKSLKSRQPLD